MRRRRGWLMGLALLGVSALAAAWVVVQGAPPRAQGRFRMLMAVRGEHHRLDMTPVGKILFKTQLLNRLANSLNKMLRLEHDVWIREAPCKLADAYYDSGSRTIVLCDGLFTSFEKILASVPPKAFENAVLGATAFVFLHEVGHALIEQFHLPVLGREEDAADGLATWLAVSGGARVIAFAGADSFRIMGDHQRPGADMRLWDSHSLDQQRAYDILCWVYGSAPKAYGFLVRTGYLPRARAARCPAQWAELDWSARTLLAPDLREHRVKSQTRARTGDQRRGPPS